MTTAIAYYSRASAAKHTTSAFYLAVIHHFGIGVPVNVARAERYYSSVVTEGEHVLVKYSAQMLRMVAFYHDSVFIKPVHTAIRTAIALFWK